MADFPPVEREGYHAVDSVPKNAKASRDVLDKALLRQMYMKIDINDVSDFAPAVSEDESAPIHTKLLVRKFRKVKHEWEQPLPILQVGHTFVTFSMSFARKLVTRSHRGVDPEGKPYIKPFAGDEIVKSSVVVADIGLSERARKVLIEMMGPRYNPRTGVLRITAKKYPTREENVRYLAKLYKSVIREAQLYAGPTEAEERRDASKPVVDTEAKLREALFES